MINRRTVSSEGAQSDEARPPSWVHKNTRRATGRQTGGTGPHEPIGQQPMGCMHLETAPTAQSVSHTCPATSHREKRGSASKGASSNARVDSAATFNQGHQHRIPAAPQRQQSPARCRPATTNTCLNRDLTFASRTRRRISP